MIPEPHFGGELVTAGAIPAIADFGVGRLFAYWQRRRHTVPGTYPLGDEVPARMSYSSNPLSADLAHRRAHRDPERGTRPAHAALLSLLLYA